MKTIKIAGAGISGLTCAIVLAKAGINVEVYEKHDRIGARFHNDLQGLENWTQNQDVIEQIASYGIDPSFPYEPMSKNLQIWTSHKKLELAGDSIFYYCVKRGPGKDTLDYHLYTQSQRAHKVKIFFNSPVDNLKSVDVDATGPVLNDPTIDALASGFVFETDYPNCGVILLDDNFAPDGYSYFLVMEGTGVTVSVIFKNYTAAHTYRDNVYEKFRNELHFNIVGQRRPFAGTGNIFIRNRFETIAVGEASGFQDFMFGFGMRYAIHSGYLAAMSVLNGSDYTKAIRENIHPQMKASISNRLIYKPLGRYGYNKLAEIIAKGRTKENIHRLYSPQWWHPLIYPFAHIVFQKNTRDPQEA